MHKLRTRAGNWSLSSKSLTSSIFFQLKSRDGSQHSCGSTLLHCQVHLTSPATPTPARSPSAPPCLPPPSCRSWSFATTKNLIPSHRDWRHCHPPRHCRLHRRCSGGCCCWRRGPSACSCCRGLWRMYCVRHGWCRGGCDGTPARCWRPMHALTGWQWCGPRCRGTHHSCRWKRYKQIKVCEREIDRGIQIVLKISKHSTMVI